MAQSVISTMQIVLDPSNIVEFIGSNICGEGVPPGIPSCPTEATAGFFPGPTALTGSNPAGIAVDVIDASSSDDTMMWGILPIDVEGRDAAVSLRFNFNDGNKANGLSHVFRVTETNATQTVGVELEFSPAPGSSSVIDVGVTVRGYSVVYDSSTFAVISREELDLDAAFVTEVQGADTTEVTNIGISVASTTGDATVYAIVTSPSSPPTLFTSTTGVTFSSGAPLRVTGEIKLTSQVSNWAAGALLSLVDSNALLDLNDWCDNGSGGGGGGGGSMSHNVYSTFDAGPAWPDFSTQPEPPTSFFSTVEGFLDLTTDDFINGFLSFLISEFSDEYAPAGYAADVVLTDSRDGIKVCDLTVGNSLIAWDTDVGAELLDGPAIKAALDGGNYVSIVPYPFTAVSNVRSGYTVTITNGGTTLEADDGQGNVESFLFSPSVDFYV